MNKLLNILLIASFSMAGCYSTGQVAQSDAYNYSNNYDDAGVTYETFYDQLQPYGNWINYPGYGNVWQPRASAGFRPYETGGHWVSTVDGWAWASDYNWGWAPFHYGRWLFDQSIGWAWVPGYDWAPAWVTWGQYNDYYAWAPLAPGINISFGNSWRAPADYWCYVPRNYMGYSNMNRYTRNNYNNNVNDITIINNYNSYNQKNYYQRGPDYQEVQRYTHKTITPVAIASSPNPGPSRVVRKQFEIYRPSAGNASPARTNAVNQTRQYNGGLNGNSQVEGNTRQPNTRSYENPDLKNNRTLSNGINNNGNNVITPQNIDNTNRRFEQQRVDNIRNRRIQTPADNSGGTPERPAGIQQFPRNNQQGNQQIIRNNPAENVDAIRSQPGLQNQRNIQRPQAFPQQNERIMRAPRASPAPVQRSEPAQSRPAQIQRPNVGRPR